MSGYQGGYQGPAGAYTGPPPPPAYATAPPPPGYAGPPPPGYAAPNTGMYQPQPSYQSTTTVYTQGAQPPPQQTIYVYDDHCHDRCERERDAAEDCCLLACCWTLLCCCLLER